MNKRKKWVKNTHQIIFECKECGLWFDCTDKENKIVQDKNGVNVNCELTTFFVKDVKWKHYDNETQDAIKKANDEDYKAWEESQKESK